MQECTQVELCYKVTAHPTIAWVSCDPQAAQYKSISVDMRLCRWSTLAPPIRAIVVCSIIWLCNICTSFAQLRYSTFPWPFHLCKGAGPAWLRWVLRPVSLQCPKLSVLTTSCRNLEAINQIAPPKWVHHTAYLYSHKSHYHWSLSPSRTIIGVILSSFHSKWKLGSAQLFRPVRYLCSSDFHEGPNTRTGQYSVWDFNFSEITPWFLISHVISMISLVISHVFWRDFRFQVQFHDFTRDFCVSAEDFLSLITSLSDLELLPVISHG